MSPWRAQPIWGNESIGSLKARLILGGRRGVHQRAWEGLIETERERKSVGRERGRRRGVIREKCREG